MSGATGQQRRQSRSGPPRSLVSSGAGGGEEEERRRRRRGRGRVRRGGVITGSCKSSFLLYGTKQGVWLNGKNARLVMFVSFQRLCQVAA